MFRRLWQVALKYPLASVLLISILPRLVAVIWSRGFLHSDDYYDTVMIAHNWLRDGLFHADGYLSWRHLSSADIGRSPLYNLSLWTVMKTLAGLGVSSLGDMMYGVRALHALLSLAPVWACYRIVENVTGDRRWAVGAGLFIGLNFALPFLGVRNLIEVVGGNIWILAIYALYRWQADRQNTGAFVAGLLTGLAWMIRFQIAFAALPIPFALWYQRKSIRPALWYCLGVGVMLLFSGALDWYFLGEFARSTITNLRINYGLGALYNMSPLLYPGILLILLVPPLSIVMFWNMFKTSLWRYHLALMSSSFCFVVSHALLSNRQERFIFPIATSFMLMGVLALWFRWKEKGKCFSNKSVGRIVVGVSAAINVALLFMFTPAYPRKGLIEPILAIEQRNPAAHTLFVQPGMINYIPFNYAPVEMKRFFLRSWDDMTLLRESVLSKPPYDFVALYPQFSGDLDVYRDSVVSALGPLNYLFTVEPSYYDALLHWLNPAHNPDFRAVVYSPDGRE